MRTRVGFSEKESATVWQQWKAGATLSEIARLIGRKPGTVHGFLSRHGGLAPRTPRRPSIALTEEERENISRGLAAGHSSRAIARSLGRAASTVSREVLRNGGVECYRARAAETATAARRLRPQKLRLERNDQLRAVVEEKLDLDWSPEQIAGWLSLQHPNEPEKRVSHEAIYRALYLRSRSGFSVVASKKLRSRRRMRRSRRASNSGQTRGQIVGARTLDERPAEVEGRLVAGHWEGDLIAGRGNTFVATLVERCTRFTVMLAVAGKDTVSVVSALSAWLRTLPQLVTQSLTWDRGTELASHIKLTQDSGVPVFFCDPKSPWQRGTNENTNRLIRQYLPKGVRLDGYDQQDLDVFALRLNKRPRKVLGFRCPAHDFAKVMP
ncbi:MAG: IS30 family transposase [Myxococcota bacterium]|jgi:IS30 family transposase